MRVIFESPPVPAVDKFPDGRVIRGTAKVVARLFDPGETAEEQYVARRVALWRSTSLRSDGSIACPPPPFMTGPLPVFIPPLIIDSLPADALLAIQWELKPGGQP